MTTTRHRRHHGYLPAWVAARETGIADQRWMFKIVLAFEVRDNFGLPDGPWSLATCEQVETNMGRIQDALWGKWWYICRLQDGKVGGPGYNHEITHTKNSIINHIPGITDLGHQMVSSLVEIRRGPPIEVRPVEEEPSEVEEEQMSDSAPSSGAEWGIEDDSDVDLGDVSDEDAQRLPNTMLAFKVRENNGLPQRPWQLATCEEVENNLELVEEALWGKTWYICRLQDGRIGGPGYHYELIRTQDVSDLGHQLVMFGFKVIENNGLPESPWHLATCEEVENNMDMVKEALRDKTWCRCRLQDGKIGGPGYDYQIDHTESTVDIHIPGASDLEHQLVCT